MYVALLRLIDVKFPFRLRQRPRPVTAAFNDPYTLLGVGKAATVNDIKKAFRKKALKLHPDVNKAPDARERFMECKQAYQQLMDARQGGSSASSSYTSGYEDQQQSKARKAVKEDEEEFYGFTDFLKDLDKELGEYAAKRRGRKSAKNGTSSAAPASLLEELAALGEEFLEFLEDGLSDDTATKIEKNKNDSRYSASPDQPPREEEYGRPPPQRKTTREIIDEELADLKRKKGLK